MSNPLAIIDLGGQYCHLIARRFRDLGVHSRVLEPDVRASQLSGYSGVVLSGGPQSVYDPESPDVDPRLFTAAIPVLGICYGHQLLAKHTGGTVVAGKGEYGQTRLTLTDSNSLFAGTPDRQLVWMSHSDSLTRLPSRFKALATTESCQFAAIANFRTKQYGIQFHPEVVHTEHGTEILRNFAVRVCGIKPDTTDRDTVREIERSIQQKVGIRSVFFLVSGGVDSTVAFALCARALSPNRVLGLYVDTGLMRRNETNELRDNLRSLGLGERIHVRNEEQRFLKALAGVTDPEAKRKIIGRLFVDIQSEAMRDYGIDEDHWMLGQGTIYPDTIESGGQKGQAALIKTHHNRCAEIQQMMQLGRVVEPLVEFYKDEVRRLGMELGLDARLMMRWPFPGPGLAIRCLCRTNDEARSPEAAVLPDGFREYRAYNLPIRTVGVQGDGRTYRRAVAVEGPLDYERLEDLSTQVCNATSSYNRVIALLKKRSGEFSDAVLPATFLTRDRLETLRAADFVVRTQMEQLGLTDSVWQFPVVLIPLTFGGLESVVLRPVNSEDGMTASFAKLPLRAIESIADEILSTCGAGAVFLDITHKPPATIEWE